MYPCLPIRLPGHVFFTIMKFTIMKCNRLNELYLGLTLRIQSDLKLKMPVYSYQLKLIKICAELANINHCAVPFLSRAAVKLYWYCYTYLEIGILTKYANYSLPCRLLTE